MVQKKNATISRLKGEGVNVVGAIDRWGNTRAAVIEGPDHVAIELVELR